MKEKKVRIELREPINSIWREELNKRIIERESNLKAVYNKIKAYIDMEIPYDTIKEKFEFYVLQSIVNRAVEMAFTESKYNIDENIRYLIKIEDLEADIRGEAMHKTFNIAISDLPASKGTKCMRQGSKMLQIDKLFSNNKI